MMRIILTTICLFSFAAQITVYDISPSKESRDNFIPESIAGTLAISHPYVAQNPSSYQYLADVKKDEANAFIVAGVNPTIQLKRVTSITGISVDFLEKRMLPKMAGNSRGLSAQDFVWAGIGNVGIRRTADGFLVSGDKLLNCLVADNDLVLSRGLSHQKVAAPLMAAVEAHEKTQTDGEFSVQGVRFRIKASKMGGDNFVYQLMKPGDARRSNRSGWVGYGMQGSPFNDEVFANWYFEIQTLDGKNTLRGDALTVQLIHRYGFYQTGKYRMDPIKIIQFFSLKS